MACDTISISGKMFVTGSGRSVTRFMVRGVALSSNLNILPGYDDLLAEEHYTYLDEIILPKLRALNVNVVRLYSVDPTKSHQKAMALLEANGIYAMVGLADKATSINRFDPSYSVALYVRAQSIIDEFQAFTNTFCFSTSNELVYPGEQYVYVQNANPNEDQGSWVSKTVAMEKSAAGADKSLIGDLKGYIKTKGYRAIPVGMSHF